jgi:hypothetical protein
MPVPKMFTVRITFKADGPDPAARLLAGFRRNAPFLAPGLLSVRAEGSYVTVEFDRLSDDPTMGPTSVGHATPGAEIVAALEGFSNEHSVAIPVFRALLTVIAISEKAGLAPSSELRIDVVSADALPQDSLSTHRSESVHPVPTQFGG